MTRIVFTAAADADMDGVISNLFASAGFRTARKYIDKFSAMYDSLAAYPYLGARRPALGPNIRIGIVSPYIVIYQYNDASPALIVLRVVHSRRRISGGLLR